MKAGSPARWEPAVGDPAVLVQSGRDVLAPRAGGAIVAGTSGYEQVFFVARARGETSLVLTRARPAREGGGTQRFAVRVAVD